MAAGPPLNRLALAAGSVADDLGFVALADLAGAVGELDSRIIGGHMVQLLVHRWQLGSQFYRETQDVDLGVPPVAVRDPTLIERLEALGYERLAGNRFGRPIGDLSARAAGGSGEKPRAVVDVLVPAYRSRARHDRRFGDHLVTAEVRGLAEAFRRDAVVFDLQLRRLNGEVLTALVAVPDEVSALILKVFAWQTRLAAKDAVDIWRCGEIALAAGARPDDFAGASGEAVRDELWRSLNRRDGGLIVAIARSRNLSSDGADRLHTRLRAVVQRVVGGTG